MLNNINTDALAKFLEEIKTHPEVARKPKRVEGTWSVQPGQAPFRAKLPFTRGELVLEADFVPFMGGSGLAPDPVQYVAFGLAACYAGTFVTTATSHGVELQEVKIAVEAQLDLGPTFGISTGPIIPGVTITMTVASNAPLEKLEEIEAQAKERCPSAYWLTHAIPLTVKLEKLSPS